MDDDLFADSSFAERDHLRAIEAVVLVAHDPVPPELLAQLLERSITDIERWCHQLAAGYEAEDRGFELVRVAGGYRLQTHPDLTPYVERFLLHDQRARLSGAALETLAIVAYKQPISRGQIASIRGVDATAEHGDVAIDRHPTGGDEVLTDPAAPPTPRGQHLLQALAAGPVAALARRGVRRVLLPERRLRGSRHR